MVVISDATSLPLFSSIVSSEMEYNFVVKHIMMVEVQDINHQTFVYTTTSWRIGLHQI